MCRLIPAFAHGGMWDAVESSGKKASKWPWVKIMSFPGLKCCITALHTSYVYLWFFLTRLYHVRIFWWHIQPFSKYWLISYIIVFGWKCLCDIWFCQYHPESDATLRKYENSCFIWVKWCKNVIDLYTVNCCVMNICVSKYWVVTKQKKKKNPVFPSCMFKNWG